MKVKYVRRGVREVHVNGRLIATLKRDAEGWNVAMEPGVSSVKAAGPFTKQGATEYVGFLLANESGS